MADELVVVGQFRWDTPERQDVSGCADIRSLQFAPEPITVALRRPSIPPVRLFKASLSMALFSVRSEHALRERLDDDVLFRWFLESDLIEPGFDHSSFLKNRGAHDGPRGGAGILWRGGLAATAAQAAA